MKKIVENLCLAKLRAVDFGKRIFCLKNALSAVGGVSATGKIGRGGQFCRAALCSAQRSQIRITNIDAWDKV